MFQEKVTTIQLRFFFIEHRVNVKAGLWTGPWTGLWTGLWTDIWTGFWTEFSFGDDHFLPCLWKIATSNSTVIATQIITLVGAIG